MMHFKELSASLLFALVLTPLAAPTQSAAPADKLPTFEVATIKPIDTSPGVMHMVGTNVYPGGRVKITTFSLKSLICAAFNLSYWQVSGGDDLSNKDHYDVEAKPPETSPAVDYDLRHSNFGIEDERLRQMLQALLIDRFQLKFHRETTTGMVYLLERNGKPTPLAASQEKAAKMYGEGFSGDVGHAGDRWVLYNTSMPQLARFASMAMSCPVLDRTELTGSFDAKWTMTLTDQQTFDGMDSFPLFLEFMGLKLTKSTGPVETFVIDHAEKPTPN
jgi:uncharacterized protein (TIGR03435 family)